MAIHTAGSDTDDDAKSFYTTRSNYAAATAPPTITTYPPVAAVLPGKASSSRLASGSNGTLLEPQSAHAQGTQRQKRPEHIKIQAPSHGKGMATDSKPYSTPVISPAPTSSTTASSTEPLRFIGPDDDDDDDEGDGRRRGQQDEHFFLIGDDMSAIPFFEAPRVIVANGPAPAPEDFIWHDEATYQAVLNKTTVRCVNILGETALKEPEEGGGKYKLKLIEMCDERVPPNMRATVGKGYYCCLMQEQEYLPRACLAVYHINPHYSTEFLYRVKAFSYDSDEPLVAEQPESVLLALIGRQMALSNCLIGVISNGSFLIVVEAGTQNSTHSAHLRTHPQAFVDCAHDWTDNQEGSLRSKDGQVHRSSHHQLHSLPTHAQPYTDHPPVVNPLERHFRNSNAYPWERENEARQQGFERADMMFAWYAVMLYAYEKHLQFALCTLQIFQAHIKGRRDVDLGAIPAMPPMHGVNVGLGLGRNVANVNCEDGIAARERYEEIESDDPAIHDDDAGDALGRMAEVREGLQIRRGSNVAARRGSANRNSPRINAPAPAWLRPASTASSRHHSQAYDYNYNGHSYAAVDSGLPSPTITTPLEPASPSELGAGAPGSGNRTSWFGGAIQGASGAFNIPGTGWLRAATSSSPARVPQPQHVYSSEGDILHLHGQGRGGPLNGGTDRGGAAQAADLPSSPGWVQWSPGTSPRQSAEMTPVSSVGSPLHRPKAIRAGQQQHTQGKRGAQVDGDEMELANISASSSTTMRRANDSYERHCDVPPSAASKRDMTMEEEHETLLPPPAGLMTQRFGDGGGGGGGGGAAGGNGRGSPGVMSLREARSGSVSPRPSASGLGLAVGGGGGSSVRLAPSASGASVRSVSSSSSVRTNQRVMAGGAAAI